MQSQLLRLLVVMLAAMLGTLRIRDSGQGLSAQACVARIAS